MVVDVLFADAVMSWSFPVALGVVGVRRAPNKLVLLDAATSILRLFLCPFLDFLLLLTSVFFKRILWEILKEKITF